jgi:hypothetical protein
VTREEAMTTLGFRADDRSPLTEDEVRSFHRKAAAIYHPDVGGSDDAMRETNEARDVLLAELGSSRVVSCVCRGFQRNPLCRAHGDEKSVVEEKDELAEACVCRGFARNPLCKAHTKG